MNTMIEVMLSYEPQDWGFEGAVEADYELGWQAASRLCKRLEKLIKAEWPHADYVARPLIPSHYNPHDWRPEYGAIEPPPFVEVQTRLEEDWADEDDEWPEDHPEASDVQAVIEAHVAEHWEACLKAARCTMAKEATQSA